MRSNPLAGSDAVVQGLGANRSQIALLVLVNAFVGGMVGLERTVVPLLGTQEFGLQSELVLFTFIIVFGTVKACANLATGALVGRFTRKSLLVAGWAVALPVPFMLGWGPTWTWIIAANVLLGISQGLSWSMTVMMKIDLAGKASRGLVVGLNEFAGYGAVGVTAWLTGFIAAQSGLRPAPFVLGIAYALIGFALSVVVVRDTSAHAASEGVPESQPITDGPRFGRVFADMTFANPRLASLSQAGLVTNLNDGMSWGVFPLLFAAHGLAVDDIGVIKAVYPLTWSVCQIATGILSDRLGRKVFIVVGMIVQALGQAVIGFGIASPWLSGLAGAMLLGLGTAMVYPVLIAAVGDSTSPAARPRALGVYRFWRDLGYAIGALMSGLVAVRLGLLWTVHVSGALTFLSGIVAWATLPGRMR